MSGWIRDSGRDRRRAVRRTPDLTEPLSRVRLRAGRELAVVDLSNGGMLVEGHTRLLPGTHVDVHVITREGRVLVRSRIARAYVCHVQSDDLRYRGALVFERPVDTTPAEYVVPDALRDPPAPRATEPAPE